MSAATDRRAFLARGIAVPPAMVMLLSTSLASPAIAASGGTISPPTGGGGGPGDNYPGPGPGGGGSGGGGGPSSPNINYPYFDQPTGVAAVPPSGIGPAGGGGAASAPMASSPVAGGGGASPRALAAPKTRVRTIAMAGERG
ncbi:MAG: hypothetical protein ABW128_01455 [Rhizorhabdus sp.]